MTTTFHASEQIKIPTNDNRSIEIIIRNIEQDVFSLTSFDGITIYNEEDIITETQYFVKRTETEDGQTYNILTYIETDGYNATTRTELIDLNETINGESYQILFWAVRHPIEFTYDHINHFITFTNIQQASIEQLLLIGDPFVELSNGTQDGNNLKFDLNGSGLQSNSTYEVRLQMFNIDEPLLANEQLIYGEAPNDTTNDTTSPDGSEGNPFPLGVITPGFQMSLNGDFQYILEEFSNISVDSFINDTTKLVIENASSNDSTQLPFQFQKKNDGSNDQIVLIFSTEVTESIPEKTFKITFTPSDGSSSQTQFYKFSYEQQSSNSDPSNDNSNNDPVQGSSQDYPFLLTQINTGFQKDLQDIEFGLQDLINEFANVTVDQTITSDKLQTNSPYFSFKKINSGGDFPSGIVFVLNDNITEKITDQLFSITFKTETKFLKFSYTPESTNPTNSNDSNNSQNDQLSPLSVSNITEQNTIHIPIPSDIDVTSQNIEISLVNEDNSETLLGTIPLSQLSGDIVLDSQNNNIIHSPFQYNIENDQVVLTLKKYDFDISDSSYNNPDNNLLLQETISISLRIDKYKTQNSVVFTVNPDDIVNLKLPTSVTRIGKFSQQKFTIQIPQKSFFDMLKTNIDINNKNPQLIKPYIRTEEPSVITNFIRNELIPKQQDGSDIIPLLEKSANDALLPMEGELEYSYDVSRQLIIINLINDENTVSDLAGLFNASIKDNIKFEFIFKIFFNEKIQGSTVSGSYQVSKGDKESILDTLATQVKTKSKDELRLIFDNLVVKENGKDTLQVSELSGLSAQDAGHIVDATISSTDSGKLNVKNSDISKLTFIPKNAIPNNSLDLELTSLSEVTPFSTLSTTNVRNALSFPTCISGVEFEMNVMVIFGIKDNESTPKKFNVSVNDPGINIKIYRPKSNDPEVFELLQYQEPLSQLDLYKNDVVIASYNNKSVTITVGSAIISEGTNEPPLQNSTVCFLKDTIIRTDQGYINIQDIRDTHTIDGHKCIGMSVGYYTGENLVVIRKNSLGMNIPNRDTYVTPLHSILINKKPVIAKRLVGIIKGIEYIPYDYSMGMVYNPLFKQWLFIHANNMIAESLHPNFDKEHNYIIMFEQDTKLDNIQKEKYNTLFTTVS